MDPRYNSYKRSTAKLPVCICKGAYCNTQEKIESIWLEQNIYRFHKSEDCRKLKKESSTTEITTSNSATTNANDSRLSQETTITETTVSSTETTTTATTTTATTTTGTTATTTTTATITTTATTTTAISTPDEKLANSTDRSGLDMSGSDNDNTSNDGKNLTTPLVAADETVQLITATTREFTELSTGSTTVTEEGNGLNQKEYMLKNVTEGIESTYDTEPTETIAADEIGEEVELKPGRD